MKKFFKFVGIVIVGLIVLVAVFGDHKGEKARNNVADSVAIASVEESKPSLEIIKHSITSEEIMGTKTIHCRVKNNTTELVSYLDIKATFYDKSGNIVGTGLGNAANLAGGAEKTIDVMAMGIENAETYEVQIDNVMGESGF